MAKEKKLKPIRLEPVPPITLLGGEAPHMDAIARNQARLLPGLIRQLEQFAARAEVGFAELLENKPLLRIAEKDYGLGNVATAKKVGAPAFWTPARLLHLWGWVHKSGKPSVMEGLRAYRRRFETGCNTDDSLKTVYYDQAIPSPLVKFAMAIHNDSRTSDLVADFLELECWRLLPGWPEQDQKKL